MKRKNKKQLKKGDVYHFQWSKEEYEKQSWGGALNHCFEGLLVVMDVHDKIMLVDTFWGINRVADNYTLTLNEAKKRGNLNFYCNLNDIEKIEKWDLDKYDDRDLFMLHDQHACVDSCKYWYKTKGAKKSPAKRISVIDEEIRKAKSDIEYRVARIESLSSEKRKLEINGFE